MYSDEIDLFQAYATDKILEEAHYCPNELKDINFRRVK